MAPDLPPPDLSVVIPIRNEEPNLRELHQELTATLGPWGRSYEILIVDDGSTDGSLTILRELVAQDPHLRVIRFRRNFGQTAAFSAGFAQARGGVIVTSDGDPQNDPRDIPALVAELEAGCDIVCRWRKSRKDTWLTRRLPSMIANKLIWEATGVALHDYGCSLKAFRAEVVKPLRLYGEMHRFIPAIASDMGVTIAEQVVNHRPRRHGVSKYGLSRTVRVVLDLLTVKFLLRYATRPLQIFGLIGMIMGGLGVLVTGWLIYVRLFQAQSIGDRPLLLFGILLVFTGLQFLTIGLLAELQIRTYHESQDKPTYAIREVIGGGAETAAPPRLAEPLRAVGPEGAGPRRGAAVTSVGREHDPRITVIQRELFDERTSKARRYASLVVGLPGWGALLRFELITLLCGTLPGALGLFLRSKLYPRLLGAVGRNVTFGANVTLRHPHKIRIGDNVVIDDGCCLDAKGTDNRGIAIGSGVFVGRNTILSCKNGDIEIGDDANLGFNVEIFSGSRVRVGRKVLVAAYTYLVGGDHLYDRTDIPVLDQGRTARGIDVDDHVWLGAHVVVTDGSRIGRDAIVGAGAVVVGEIPEFAIAVGTPARVVRDRREPAADRDRPGSEA